MQIGTIGEIGILLGGLGVLVGGLGILFGAIGIGKALEEGAAKAALSRQS